MERSAQARRLEARKGRPAALVAPALTLALAASTPGAFACDSTSCALLTRDLTGFLPKGALRIDLSFRRTDDGQRLEGSGFVQVPGYRYVNEAQLAPRSSFLAGVSKTF